MTGGLRIERGEGYTRLVLNRPDRGNALSAPLVEGLLAAVEDAKREGARLVVLEGEGASFSTGFDFTAIEEETDATLAYRFIRIEMLLQALCGAPFETLALAHGRVFGAGVDLVNACSRRVAAPGTTFRMPGLAFGVALGTRRFIRCVGEAGRSILAENRTFDADEAHRIRFIHDIVDRPEWPQAVERTARRARILPQESAKLLSEIAQAGDGDADMGVLARSVGRPGLKERMLAYRTQSRGKGARNKSDNG